MNEPKVTVNCSNCGCKFRFPIKENLIRFKCPSCKTKFEAINGRIVDEENEINNKNDNSLNNSTKKSRLKFNFSKYITWRNISFLLMLLSLFLLLKMYFGDSDRRKKEYVTNQFINTINSLKNGEEVDTLSLSYLTSDTKKLYHSFILSQYKHNDSISLLILDKFWESLTPLEYEERKLVSYNTTEGDTLYFYLNYIKSINSGEYKIDIKLKDFMK